MPSQDSNATFPWPRLDLDDKNFRLLRFVLSKCRHATIHCELDTVSQSQFKGQYIACSYVWGPDSPTKKIMVNGKPFTIRKNLFDFLRSLIAQGNGNKRFWVDAICIRQNSHFERQHQVSIMHDIFADAAAVYSWLGPSKGMSHLFDIASDWSFGLDRSHKADEALEKKEKIQIAELRIIQKRRFEEIKKNLKGTVDELLALSRSAYWSRLWICPEFVVNPRVRIFWGFSSVEYDNFQTYLNCFESITHLPKLPDTFRSMIKTRNNRHCGWENYQSPQTLEYYFDIFGHKSCQRPLDRIFALLGIVGEADCQLRRTSIIDYELTPQELLCRLLVSCNMDTPLRFIKNFMRCFEIGVEHSSFDLTTKSETSILFQTVSFKLSEYSKDLEVSESEQVQTNSTLPLKEVELHVRKHHNNVVTAFLCDGQALDKLCLFKAGRIDDFRFQHHVFLVARRGYRKSTSSPTHVIIGLGIHSTIIDKCESDRLKELAVRKSLRKAALDNLKRYFNWGTLAASLQSFSEASSICEQSTSEGKLSYRLESGLPQLLSLVAEIPGDIKPESLEFD